MKGGLNAYTCGECGRRIVTIDVDEGTTPFAIGCCEADGECLGAASSSFYSTRPEDVPTHEWYRPGRTEYATLDEATKAHVDQCGLLLRPIRMPAGIAATG